AEPVLEHLARELHFVEQCGKFGGSPGSSVRVQQQALQPIRSRLLTQCGWDAHNTIVIRISPELVTAADQFAPPFAQAHLRVKLRRPAVAEQTADRDLKRSCGRLRPTMEEP